MTETLQRMIENGKGYRTEAFRGSGERDLRKVVSFEIKDLCNVDIPFTMNEFYPDFDIARFNLESRDIYEVSEVELDDLVSVICEYVSRKAGRNEEEIEVLWLTTKEGVEEYYSDNYDEDTKNEEDEEDEDTIDCYSISQDNFVISDLGEEGGLFVLS